MWKPRELPSVFLTCTVSFTCLAGGGYTPVIVFHLWKTRKARTSFFLAVHFCCLENRKLPWLSVQSVLNELAWSALGTGHQYFYSSPSGVSVGWENSTDHWNLSSFYTCWCTSPQNWCKRGLGWMRDFFIPLGDLLWIRLSDTYTKQGYYLSDFYLGK